MPNFFVPFTNDRDHAEVVYRNFSTRPRNTQLTSREARLFRVGCQYDDWSRAYGRRLQSCVAEVGKELIGGTGSLNPVLSIFETTTGIEIIGLSDNRMSLEVFSISPLYISEKIYFQDFPENPSGAIAAGILPQ